MTICTVGHKLALLLIYVISHQRRRLAASETEFSSVRNLLGQSSYHSPRFGDHKDLKYERLPKLTKSFYEIGLHQG